MFFKDIEELKKDDDRRLNSAMEVDKIITSKLILFTTMFSIKSLPAVKSRPLFLLLLMLVFVVLVWSITQQYMLQLSLQSNTRDAFLEKIELDTDESISIKKMEEYRRRRIGKFSSFYEEITTPEGKKVNQLKPNIDADGPILDFAIAGKLFESIT